MSALEFIARTILWMFALAAAGIVVSVVFWGLVGLMVVT